MKTSIKTGLSAAVAVLSSFAAWANFGHAFVSENGGTVKDKEENRYFSLVVDDTAEPVCQDDASSQSQDARWIVKARVYAPKDFTVSQLCDVYCQMIREGNHSGFYAITNRYVDPELGFSTWTQDSDVKSANYGRWYFTLESLASLEQVKKANEAHCKGDARAPAYEHSTTWRVIWNGKDGSSYSSSPASADYKIVWDPKSVILRWANGTLAWSNDHANIPSPSLFLYSGLEKDARYTVNAASNQVTVAGVFTNGLAGFFQAYDAAKKEALDALWVVVPTNNLPFVFSSTDGSVSVNAKYSSTPSLPFPWHTDSNKSYASFMYDWREIPGFIFGNFGYDSDLTKYVAKLGTALLNGTNYTEKFVFDLNNNGRFKDEDMLSIVYDVKNITIVTITGFGEVVTNFCGATWKDEGKLDSVIIEKPAQAATVASYDASTRTITVTGDCLERDDAPYWWFEFKVKAPSWIDSVTDFDYECGEDDGTINHNAEIGYYLDASLGISINDLAFASQDLVYFYNVDWDNDGIYETQYKVVIKKDGLILRDEADGSQVYPPAASDLSYLGNEYVECAKASDKVVTLADKMSLVDQTTFRIYAPAWCDAGEVYLSLDYVFNGSITNEYGYKYDGPVEVENVEYQLNKDLRNNRYYFSFADFTATFFTNFTEQVMSFAKDEDFATNNIQLAFSFLWADGNENFTETYTLDLGDLTKKTFTYADGTTAWPVSFDGATLATELKYEGDLTKSITFSGNTLYNYDEGKINKEEVPEAVWGFEFLGYTPAAVNSNNIQRVYARTLEISPLLDDCDKEWNAFEKYEDLLSFNNFRCEMNYDMLMALAAAYPEGGPVTFKIQYIWDADEKPAEDATPDDELIVVLDVTKNTFMYKEGETVRQVYPSVATYDDAKTQGGEISDDFKATAKSIFTPAKNNFDFNCQGSIWSNTSLWYLGAFQIVYPTDVFALTLDRVWIVDLDRGETSELSPDKQDSNGRYLAEFEVNFNLKEFCMADKAGEPITRHFRIYWNGLEDEAHAEDFTVTIQTKGLTLYYGNVDDYSNKAYPLDTSDLSVNLWIDEAGASGGGTVPYAQYTNLVTFTGNEATYAPSVWTNKWYGGPDYEYMPFSPVWIKLPSSINTNNIDELFDSPTIVTYCDGTVETNDGLYVTGYFEPVMDEDGRISIHHSPTFTLEDLRAAQAAGGAASYSVKFDADFDGVYESEFKQTILSDGAELWTTLSDGTCVQSFPASYTSKVTRWFTDKTETPVVGQTITLAKGDKIEYFSEKRLTDYFSKGVGLTDATNSYVAFKIAIPENLPEDALNHAKIYNGMDESYTLVTNVTFKDEGSLGNQKYVMLFMSMYSSYKYAGYAPYPAYSKPNVFGGSMFEIDWNGDGNWTHYDVKFDLTADNHIEFTDANGVAYPPVYPIEVATSKALLDAESQMAIEQVASKGFDVYSTIDLPVAKSDTGLFTGWYLCTYPTDLVVTNQIVGKAWAPKFSSASVTLVVSPAITPYVAYVNGQGTTNSWGAICESLKAGDTVKFPESTSKVFFDAQIPPVDGITLDFSDCGTVDLVASGEFFDSDEFVVTNQVTFKGNFIYDGDLYVCGGDFDYGYELKGTKGDLTIEGSLLGIARQNINGMYGNTYCNGVGVLGTGKFTLPKGSEYTLVRTDEWYGWAIYATGLDATNKAVVNVEGNVSVVFDEDLKIDNYFADNKPALDVQDAIVTIDGNITNVYGLGILTWHGTDLTLKGGEIVGNTAVWVEGEGTTFTVPADSTVSLVAIQDATGYYSKDRWQATGDALVLASDSGLKAEDVKISAGRYLSQGGGYAIASYGTNRVTGVINKSALFGGANPTVLDDLFAEGCFREDNDDAATKALGYSDKVGHVAYTLTYELNGGYEKVALKTSYTLDSEEALQGEESVAKKDWNFKGWFFDQAFTKKADTFADVVEVLVAGGYEPVTVYAKWTETQYAATLLAGDVVNPATYEGVTISDKGVQVDFDVSAPVKLATPVCAGYEFIGWFDAAGNLFTDLPQGTTDCANHILTAKWKVITYSISYTDAFGNEAADSYTVVDNVTFNANPKREGYDFTGWTIGGTTVTSTAGYAKDLVVTGTWVSRIGPEANFVKGTTGSENAFNTSGKSINYSGYVAKNGQVVGTVTFTASAAKTGNPSTVRMTLKLIDEKQTTRSMKVYTNDDGPVEINLGTLLGTAYINKNGVEAQGETDNNGFCVFAAPNAKAAKQNYTVAYDTFEKDVNLGATTLRIQMTASGRATVSGVLYTGKKFSVSAQAFSATDNTVLLPVVYNRSYTYSGYTQYGGFAGLFRIKQDGSIVTEDYAEAKVVQYDNGALLDLDLGEASLGKVATAKLAEGDTIGYTIGTRDTVYGKATKSGTIKFTDANGKTISGTSLTYTYTTGALSGKMKVTPAGLVGAKAVSATVTGVMINGQIGYGTAVYTYSGETYTEPVVVTVNLLN